MPATSPFGSAQRTEALTLFARHSTSPLPLAGPHPFGANAALAVDFDSRGRSFAVIDTGRDRIRVTNDADHLLNTRPLTAAEEQAFNALLPAIANTLGSQVEKPVADRFTALIDPETHQANRFAVNQTADLERQQGNMDREIARFTANGQRALDQLNANRTREGLQPLTMTQAPTQPSQPSNAREIPQTVMARPMEQYLSRYITPAIAEHRTAYARGLELASRDLLSQNPNVARIARVFADDRGAFPAHLRSIQSPGDDALYLLAPGTTAASLLADTQQAGRTQLACIDSTRPADQLETGPAIGFLSTEESARLLTNLDPSRNLTAWRTALQDHSTPEPTREIARPDALRER